jgi:hypothetical protein
VSESDDTGTTIQLNMENTTTPPHNIININCNHIPNNKYVAKVNCQLFPTSPVKKSTVVRQLFPESPVKKSSATMVTMNATSKEEETTDCVHSYVDSVSMLLEKLKIIIELEIKYNKEEVRSKSSGNLLMQPLNKSLSKNVHFNKICKILSTIHGHRVSEKIPTTPDSLYLLFCDGSEEKRNTLCSNTILSIINKSEINTRCSCCQNELYKRRKRLVRRERNGHNWVTSDSKCNWSHLSPGSAKKRVKNVRNEKSILNAKLKKLNGFDETLSLKPSNRVEGDIIKMMCRVGNVSKDIFRAYREELINELVQGSAHGPNSSPNRDQLQHAKEDIETFVDITLERIMNFKKVLDGKQTQVRFSPREIRMAMTLYNRSPSGYRDMKDSSIQILPSISLIKKYHAGMKLKDGEEAALYGTIQDRLNIDGIHQCYGVLMLDEMKLKHDIYVNMITGEVVGFASSREDFMMLRDDVRAILTDLNAVPQQDTNVVVTDDVDESSEMSASEYNCKTFEDGITWNACCKK